MSPPPDDRAPLDAAERERLESLRSAESLADLVALTGAESEHDAYFAAKEEWADLRDREGSGHRTGEPQRNAVSHWLPGTSVDVDGHEFSIHGITHADTDAERERVRAFVEEVLDRGATVYCEQGIRQMYVDDVDGVCSMDDLRWAMRECERLDADSRLEAVVGDEFEGILEDLTEVASEFQEATFSLIESGRDVYGDTFASALGDVASDFLTDHADHATGDDFESFALTRRAAQQPDRLLDLQRYYARTFLPQPVEREWLRRHDRELEIVTHARNERMAEYAVYHNERATEVHLIVGAAHQPGVRYYLERIAAGERDPDYEPVL